MINHCQQLKWLIIFLDWNVFYSEIYLFKSNLTNISKYFIITTGMSFKFILYFVILTLFIWLYILILYILMNMIKHAPIKFEIQRFMYKLNFALIFPDCDVIYNITVLKDGIYISAVTYKGQIKWQIVIARLWPENL
jgi:hypothetical protein